MMKNTQSQVAVAIVNYNTVEALSHLIFSLFHVVPRSQLAKVVVVDNGSTDGSVQLLQTLIERGLVEAILNREQHYHGPALNQAMDYLCAQHHLAATLDNRIETVWVLDSDTVVLREDVVSAALSVMQKLQAGMLGQFQYDALPAGYAHPSSLFLDLQKTFLAGRGRFDISGAPATELHHSLRRAKIPIADFPVFDDGYVLHIGRGTRRALHNRKEHTNRHFQGSAGPVEAHYHGKELHRQFLERFHAEIPEFSPERLADACFRRAAIEPTHPVSTTPL